MPNDIGTFVNMTSCVDAKLPKDATIENLLKVLLDAERCAVGVYNEILDYIWSNGYRTSDLALAILHEETEHEAWFEELLTGKPSGHFRRRIPGGELIRVKVPQNLAYRWESSMPRLILFKSKTTFYDEEKHATICRCGLSKTYPYCSGAHINVADEKEKSIYLYDKEDRRLGKVKWIVLEDGGRMDPRCICHASGRIAEAHDDG